MDSSVKIDQAILLSERILQAIQSQDWDSIAIIDDERNSLIKQYFNSPEGIEPNKVKHLKQLNEQIVSQLVKLQQSNRNRQISLTQAQKVSQAYLENA